MDTLEPRAVCRFVRAVTRRSCHRRLADGHRRTVTNHHADLCARCRPPDALSAAIPEYRVATPHGVSQRGRAVSAPVDAPVSAPPGWEYSRCLPEYLP